MRYFTIDEFECNCGGIYCDGGVDLVSSVLTDALDELREIVGFPFVVTSGYRCPDWNERHGGVKDSQHLAGRAADIKITRDMMRAGVDAAAIADHAETLEAFASGGIGLYNSFIHLDVRPDGPARWDRRR